MISKDKNKHTNKNVFNRFLKTKFINFLLYCLSHLSCLLKKIPYFYILLQLSKSKF